MKYFDENSTLLEIVESYPETVAVFSSNGFQQMEERDKREKFAGTISLKMALLLKCIDFERFSKLLVEALKTKSRRLIR